MPEPSPESIQPGGGLWGARLLTFAQLPSTNDWALAHAVPSIHGDLVRAVFQSAGRGRQQRVWITPPAVALTVSVILKPDPLADCLPSWLGAAAALAVCETLQAAAIPAQVKWPNDVLVKGRKIAGILAERGGAGPFIILGLGLNVNQSAADLDAGALLQPATAMALESGTPHRLEAVLQDLRPRLESMLTLATPDGRDQLASAWRRHDALTGHAITVEGANATLQGDYLGLDAMGALRLRVADGDTRTLFTGDVRSLRIQPTA